MNSSSPIIHFDRVSKIYNPGGAEVAAIDGADFKIYAGEFVAVTGESGSGKSTLLHLMGALDRPSSGSVTVDGLSTGDADEADLTRFRRERLGFVFQFFNLLPGMTILENVSLPLLLSGAGKDEAEARALDQLERAGLRAKTGRFPDQLSGGEMQRAAVARALVHRPSILLADEPTGNLDSANAVRILDAIASAAGETTVVLVTHSAEAAGRAGRRLHVKDGRVEQA